MLQREVRVLQSSTVVYDTSYLVDYVTLKIKYMQINVKIYRSKPWTLGQTGISNSEIIVKSCNKALLHVSHG
jgi:hypothetical protein